MNSQTSTSTRRFVDAILEHIPVAVAVYDTQDLRLLEANTLFLTIMDRFLDPAWHQGRIIGSPLAQWAHPATIPRLVTVFRAVAETGTTYQAGEFAFPTSHGDITYWNWMLERMDDHDRQGIHLLQTITEVTAHVLARQEAERAQDSLRQTTHLIEAERQRLAVIDTVARSVREAVDTESIGRTAIEAIEAAIHPLSVCIYTADPIQQVLHLLHIRPATGTKETFLQSIPYDNSSLVAQAHIRQDPIIIEDLQVAAASGIVVRTHPLVTRGVRGYICVPLRFKDHFEGTLASLFTYPLSADGAEVQMLEGCAMPIAAALAHARLLTEIKHEQARLRAVLDQLPEGVVIIEASDGCVSYANAAAERIAGTSGKSMLGHSLIKHTRSGLITYLDGRPIPDEDLSTVRALQGETRGNQELIVTRHDGSQVPILATTAPLRLESGVITGSVTVFQDITERKSLEQQKNDFLSMASHELRTPIASIQGFAEILQLLMAEGQIPDAPHSIRAINTIVEQSQHLTRLIEEMLDLTRLEHAKLPFQLASHDLLSILVQVIESQAVVTRQHDLRLVLDGLQASDRMIGYFDEQRIVQVLSNLISNAIKYSPNGGEIEIGLRHTLEKPDEALIWVRDSGIGIPVDALPHIFERYYRSGKLNRAMSGLGIGLYLVKEIVTRHRGRVWVESSEGVGSTFYILLPLDNHQF